MNLYDELINSYNSIFEEKEEEDEESVSANESFKIEWHDVMLLEEAISCPARSDEIMHHIIKLNHQNDKRRVTEKTAENGSTDDNQQVETLVDDDSLFQSQSKSLTPQFLVPAIPVKKMKQLISTIESEENASSQMWTLTQQTQEMEPLSLLMPNTQEFERQYAALDAGHEPNTTKRPASVNDDEECVSPKKMALSESNPIVTFSVRDVGMETVVLLLGGKTVSSIADATVYVNSNPLMTSKKQLAIKRNLAIVSINWIIDSMKSQSFQCKDLYLDAS